MKRTTKTSISTRINILLSQRLVSRLLLWLKRNLKKAGLHLSFSEDGEDTILEHLSHQVFGANYKGRYIDIGCNFPVVCNNTISLYLNGWSGTCVDGNNYFRKFYKIRPRDKFINKLVTNKQEKTQILYKPMNALGSSTTTPEWADNLKANGFNLSTESVETISLLEIINQTGGADILTIDVEGAEFNVLQSLGRANTYESFSALPKIIMLETFNNDNAETYKDVGAFLAEFGFAIRWRSRQNIYFVRD